MPSNLLMFQQNILHGFYSSQIKYMRRFVRFGNICTIYKNVKNTHERVLLLVKLQASACNFT